MQIEQQQIVPMLYPSLFGITGIQCNGVEKPDTGGGGPKKKKAAKKAPAKKKKK